MSTSMPARGKVPAKGKGKQREGKGQQSKWRPACDDYWKPGGCSQGHNCPKYHPRRQPGRCANVVLPDTLLRSVLVQSNLKPRMPSGMSRV